MIGRRTTLSVVLAMCWGMSVASPEGRQAPDLAAVVAQHYPHALVEESLEVRGVQPNRQQCFAVLEASASGMPQVVVAGYTNLMSGAVRVLRAVAGGFQVVAAAGDDHVAGSACEIEPLDVDNDGRKEAVVHFLTRNSSEDWVFRWDDENLHNLSPTTTDVLGLTATRLLNASFVDIDGDNVMEAFTFSEPPREGQPSPGEFYRLVGGAFTIQRSIAGMRSFQRTSGAPQTHTETILLPTGAVGPFTLRIMNGAGTTGSGKRVENAVESGRVWWNGQEIVSPNHFGNHVALIERTVTMQAENELKVRLAGSPDGRIVIIIDAASWTP